ncbi:MAG: hypothetical protein J6W35_05225 [Eubacterium sp.]|nr:hypothetical protein [Eubacterium sp.]
MSFKEDIVSYIRSGETDHTNLGLEIEHFVVDENGDQIGFEEITDLIETVSDKLNAKTNYSDGYPVGYTTDEYAITLEPSCQFEISINPYKDLEKIEYIYKEFIKVWEPLFKERGYKIVTNGNLPKVEQGLTTPDDITLTPKIRYKYMDEYLSKSGKYSRYMMRASASTQLSIDYKSEKDLAKKLRVLEKISPILMIIAESKEVKDFTLSGNEGQTHLLRIQEWDDLDPARTGFLKGSLDEGFGYEDIADINYNMPLILLTKDGDSEYVKDDSAKDLIEKGVITESDLQDKTKSLIEHVFSMGFFHYRVKTYIELRVADSMPIDKALGFTALLKGLIYDKSNLDYLDENLSNIKSLDEIQSAIDEIKVDGFDAKIYDGKTAYEWADELVKLADNGLEGKDKEYLKNVRAFWSDIKS